MANKIKVEAAVASLIELGRDQLEAGDDADAKDSFLNALNIAVRNLKLGQHELEPLVAIIHSLTKLGA